MTLKEFITECELFRYSKENYDLIKEASELNLMRHYIEGQSFMAENAILIAESASFLTEGFMLESAAESNLKVLEEKFAEKFAKFKDNVRKLWNKIINAVISFFTNLWKGTKDLSAKIKDICDKLAIRKVTDADKEAIIKVINDAIAESGAPISEKQQEGFNKLPSNILVLSDNSIKNKLAAVLVNKAIHTTIAADGKFSKALSEKQFNELFRAISENYSNEPEVKKLLDGFITNNIKKGIYVDNGKEEGAADKFIADLKAYADKINESIISDVDNNIKTTEIHDKLYADVSTSVAHGIDLYGAVNRYKMLVVTGLTRILKD